MTRKWKLLLLNCLSAGLLTFFTSIGTAMALLPTEVPLYLKILVACGNAGALATVTFLSTFRKLLGFDKEEQDPPETSNQRIMSLCEFNGEHKTKKKKTIKELISICSPFAFFV